MRPQIDTILFDLDGTLLDTHMDLCKALNTVLKSHGKQPLPIASLRPFVSKGAMVMVCLAFRCQPTSDQAKKLWLEMLDAYAMDIATHTVLFPGMEAVLEKIENSGRHWGIVTNKPGYFTDLLLAEMGLDTRAGSIVAGDTLKVKKPSPEPLLHACKLMAADPIRTMYVGDDERDIQAGQKAGMTTIAAAYGYIVEEDDPANWGADEIIHHACELNSWLD